MNKKIKDILDQISVSDSICIRNCLTNRTILMSH